MRSGANRKRKAYHDLGHKPLLLIRGNGIQLLRHLFFIRQVLQE